ncbi:MAG: penicillin acylase family protein [Chloroflexi bacterium]|nr:penicillin acylase family protein [Chloroflexota bacterium]MCA2001110.1 penicillin acylase family protein [Chloroflexota bacterium]
MKKIGKFLGRGLLAVVIFALIVAAGGTFYFKRYLPQTVAPKSFPQIEGEIQLDGLDGAVDIYRDGMGIPHIYASTTHDLFFAQGYVHAQDRFWQMDTWRHVGSGSLSEMFGKGQVKTDAFLRTLGWRRVAEQEWESLSPESKEILQAYADGVNAYLKDREAEAVSLEYAVLGLLSPDYKIQPWTPINSLTWGKAMAWDLGGNMDEEIERAILLKTLSPEQVAELFPEYPADYPVIVPEMGGQSNRQSPTQSPITNYQSPTLRQGSGQVTNLPALQSLAEDLARMENILGPKGPDIGSNSWAVSGKRTNTGKPLLANDMHLGIQMPSIWYQVALHCAPKSEACPFEVTGFSFAGVPGVVAGHNDRIAWAFTNLGPDVQDLFIEKVNPENPNQYEADGKWADFEIIEETINVVGGEPVTISIRVSRHGPVISETYGPLKDETDPKDPEDVPFKEEAGIDLPEHYVIALSWTALTPSSPFEAIWGFNLAQNWEEFREAARTFHVPAQNLLYADVDGNIGYQTPGMIPIRKNGDGMYPVPGWTGEYDWTGFIPFEELPYAFNPPSGYIVAANNQAHPRGYPYLITKEWDYGQRAARIVEMIENAPGKIDSAYVQQMHGDSKSLNAEVLVPVLMNVPLEPELAALRDTYLGGWDFQETADSPSAMLFEAFWWDLLMDTFGDELPDEYLPAGGSRWYAVMRNLVNQPDSPWWDDKDSEAVVETRDDVFARAFAEAAQCKRCIEKFGKDVAKWKWGELHTATFRNQTLGNAGIGLIEDLFNRGPYVTGGGKSIVNATGWVAGESFEINWLPSEREIVDLSNFDRSLALHTTGQSGHAFHPHYDDMIPLWARVQYYPMWWERESVVADSEGHLALKP